MMAIALPASVLTAWAQVAAGVQTGSSSTNLDVSEPSSYRVDGYREPTPKTLVGAKGVVTPDEARALQAAGAVFIDVYPRAPKPANFPPTTVWREPPHRSIPGAIWLPNVGYGVLAEPTAAYFTSQLARLTGNDTAKPIILFCLRDCWMSWNAAKRAITLGYSAVYWFPDGVDGWEEQGLTITNVQPTP